tara:strand:+ start:158 stop:274 length:117 start_codon:yes stop_codon:yes gene_type:complete
MDWSRLLYSAISGVCIAVPLWVFYIGVKILILDWLNGR